MKKWMFLPFVAFLAFAMIGCGGGDDNDGGEGDKTITFELGDHAAQDAVTPAPITVIHGHTVTQTWLDAQADVAAVKDKPATDYLFKFWSLKGETTNYAGRKVESDITLVAQWSPPVTITFVSYDEEAAADWRTYVLAAGQTFTERFGTSAAFPAANQKPGEWAFAYWKDSFDVRQYVDTSKWDEDTTLKGHWRSTTLTADATDTGAEKVYLHNGSYVIYEFDLDGAAIADITKLTVEYKASEATISGATIRNQRLMGPYTYYDFITHIDKGSDGLVPYYGDFVVDENGAYVAKYIASGGANDYARDKNGPYINYSKPSSWTGDWSILNGTSPTPNTWFEVEYPFSGTFFTGTTVNNVRNTGNAKVAADGGKVYFGIGLPSADDDKTGAGKGNVHLVKNVKLILADDTEIDGAVPSFPGTNGSQVFASYIDPINFNWRGSPTVATIPYPTRPTSPASEFLDMTGVDIGDATTDPVTGALNGYFYLNLADYKTGSLATVAPAIPVASVTFAGPSPVEGPLTANFTLNNERLNIGLFPDHIDALRDAGGNIIVTIDADVTSGGTNNFRYHLADPFEGGTWNSTVSFDNEPIDDLIGAANAKTLSFGSGKSRATLSYLSLQSRATSATTIVINSIKVEYTIPAIVLATPAKADWTVYKSVNAGGTDTAIKNTKAVYKNWDDLELTDGTHALDTTVTFEIQDEGEADEAQLDISSFKHFTIKVKYTKADGTELVPGVDGVPRQLGQVNIGGLDHYNLGEENPADNQCTVNAPILVQRRGKHVGLIGETSLVLNFQARNNWEAAGLAYVELLEITFLKD